MADPTPQEKLDFLKSKGLTVGLMKEAGKEPYLAYVIEPGSELCDLGTVTRLVDVEIENRRLARELDEVLKKARYDLSQEMRNHKKG